MPHGHTDSSEATAQNAATDPEAPNDPGIDQHASVKREPSAYAAPDVRDSTVAAPAAGELGDYADLEEPSGGMQQGRTHTKREAHAGEQGQGPKTRAANKAMASSGSPDQGTH